MSSISSLVVFKKMICFCVYSLFLITLHTHGQPADSLQKPSILFIYPVDKGFPFWDSQVNFAESVADALNMKLEVAYTPTEFRNRFGASEYIKLLLDERTHLPSLIITSFWVGSEKSILTYLHDKKVPLISVNSDMSEKQFSDLGRPRERFPYWLAHLSPDDTIAGKLLAEHVIQQSRTIRCPGQQCRVNIFAITGMSYSAVSNQRIAGLEAAARRDKQSRILNIVYGNWDRNLVTEMTPTIFKRHTDIHAFWIASDVMAYGLEDGINRNKIKLNRDTIIGGIDWSPATIDKINEGLMQLSVGGHFLESGWGLILFYDYINGNDFAENTGTVIKTEMSVLNKNNVDILGPFLQTPAWSAARIRGYSKTLNSTRVDYNLNPQKVILEQFETKIKNALKELQ